MPFLIDNCPRCGAKSITFDVSAQTHVTTENKLFLNASLQKAAEFSGVAGEFRCHSLHRSQIFKDL